jgi:hypothetical protein
MSAGYFIGLRSFLTAKSLMGKKPPKQAVQL